MLRIFLLLLFLVIFNNLHAQSVSWIVSGAGDSNASINGQVDTGYSVISDTENIYMTGLAIGNNAMVNDTSFQIQNNCFLSGYNREGQLKWYKQLEGRREIDVALNSKGELFIIRNTGTHSFLGKYDHLGILLWEIELLKNAILRTATSICTDSQDNIYIAGKYTNYADSLIVEDTVIHNLRNFNHAFIVKYNESGEFNWIGSTSGGDRCRFKDITVDKNDKLIVTGDFLTRDNDSLTLNTAHIKSVPDTILFSNVPSQDALIAKYDTNGLFLWVHTLGGPRDDTGSKISTDEQNDIYFVGTFEDSVKVENTIINSYGAHDIFLCKIAPDGRTIWTNTAGGTTTKIEEGTSIATDPDGNVHIAGYFYGHASFGNGDDEITIYSENEFKQTYGGFYAKYSGEGNLVWAESISGEGSTIKDISCQDTMLYMTGNFYPESNLLDQSLPISYPNSSNFFIASIVNKPLIEEPEIPTSLNSEITENDPLIYPNPTNDIMLINQSRSPNRILGIWILSQSGKTILNRMFKRSEEYNNIKINLSEFKSGLYLLKIKYADSVSIIRIIKN